MITCLKRLSGKKEGKNKTYKILVWRGLLLVDIQCTWVISTGDSTLGIGSTGLGRRRRLRGWTDREATGVGQREISPRDHRHVLSVVPPDPVIATSKAARHTQL